MVSSDFLLRGNALNTTAVVVSAAVLLAACRSEPSPPRTAVTLAITDSLQGLSGPQRDSLHHLGEGDEFMPVAWIKVLNSVETKRPFLENVERFGMIPDPSNPDGLPIGLSATRPTDVGRLSNKMVGFSCAACHTGHLKVNGKDLIIEGGASLVDAERFERELVASIEALRNPIELAGFTSRLLSLPAIERKMDSLSFKNIPKTREALKLRMAGFLAIKQLLEKTKRTEAGYGRIDAFGTSRNLLYPNSGIAMIAPVRYPKVWQFFRHKWLHWDGNANSVMERNLGQAIAAGAIYDPKTNFTTLLPENLHALEQLTVKITPPVWPAALAGPIDDTLAKRGRALYSANCERCHALPGIPERDTLIPYKEVGTDPQRELAAATPLYGRGYAVVAGELLGRVKQAAYKAHNITPRRAAEIEGDRINAEWRVTGAYMARPLTGLWATAPYLHNGSVPTLDDLLKPVAQRPVTFVLGGHQFDPVKVGITGPPPPGVTPFTFDTRATGNSNAGHGYGSTLTAAQRRQLIEYLKTL